jgi:hypothetical protein
MSDTERCFRKYKVSAKAFGESDWKTEEEISPASKERETASSPLAELVQLFGIAKGADGSHYRDRKDRY